jgi:hypothetical protein
MTLRIDARVQKAMTRLLPDGWEWKVAKRVAAPLKAEALALDLPLEWSERERQSIASDAESAVRATLVDEKGLAALEALLRKRAAVLAKSAGEAAVAKALAKEAPKYHARWLAERVESALVAGRAAIA